MDGSWVKLFRKSTDSRVWSDDFLWRLWCWCLLKANWKDGWHNGEKLEPGQFATGRDQASKELNCEKSKWYRGMKRLESWKQISLKSNNLFTVVTICNWRTYQGDDQPARTTSEQRVNNERTTSEQRVNTIEEGKEVKEGEEGKNLSSAYRHEPEDRATASWMYGKLLEINPDHREPNLERWANDLRLLRERDRRTTEQIRWLFDWANNDDFWCSNIQSPAKLRKKWDTLVVRAKSEHQKRTDPRGNIARVQEMIAGGDFE